VLQMQSNTAKVQAGEFSRLWNDPPAATMIISEDAGKRFVLNGRGLVHVMLVRSKCSNDIPKAKVTRYTIAQSWLGLLKLEADRVAQSNTIHVFHDGGCNEYNNTSWKGFMGWPHRSWCNGDDSTFKLDTR